jgi:tRNA (guanine-N7-)-methyltransferase
MSNVRLREHVNPLSHKYANPAALPVWGEVFAHPDRPLILDIGCAKGEFPLAMAHAQLDRNFLGIEIREPLVHQANEWVQQQGLTNLHFLFCNANNTLQPLLASFPTGILQQVTIQFPDPWFKRRHNKRRVVQPGRVAELAQYLAPGRTVFVQSDVLEVAEEMVERFGEHPAFVRQNADWMPENPLAVPTDRERYVLEGGAPVYRALFTRI